MLPLSSSSIGRKWCLRFIFCERRMANTEAESVLDMVAASSSEGSRPKWMLVQLIPESQQMKSPVSSAVSSTPAVESTMPCAITGRMSARRVSIPPAKRMTLSATMPMNCASRAS